MMKKLIIKSLLLMWIAATACHSTNSQVQDYSITPVPFTQVHVTDNFWKQRIETDATVTIPIAYQYSESTGRIRNFAIAGGLEEGQFQSSYPFDDSDVYKVIEGAAYSLITHPSTELEHYTDSLIHLIAAAQEDDGYLYTYRTIMGDNSHPWIGSKRWELTHVLSHELYNIGHMYEAAVAYFQATGKRELLDVAIKSANLVCDTFGWDKLQSYPGHQEIEIGLVKLYRITGEKKYLDQAKFFLDARGNSQGIKGDSYNQAHIPVIEQEQAVGHSVRAAYMYTAMADVAALTGNEDYITAIKRLWEDIAYSKLYLTGGIGADGGSEGFGGKYELPNDKAYCETCAAIANIFWNHRMFLMEGKSKYIDVLERALYNNVLSGVALSGDLFFYPNVLETAEGRERSPWFGCACCPSNICRFIPAVPGYIYATRKNDVFVNLYIAGDASISTDGGHIDLIQESNMPWEGVTTLTVNPERKHKFSLYLRIPGWARNQAAADNKLYHYTRSQASSFSIQVNGQPVEYTMDEDGGYGIISRKWSAGDIVTLSLPMEVKRVEAHQEVEADQGRLAIERGPLVFCAEGIDNPQVSPLEICVPEETLFTESFHSEILNGILMLSAEVQGVSFHAIPYYAWAQRGKSPMEVWFKK